MADDVVSTVRLEGVSQAEKDFDAIAAAGEAAMERIRKSAQPASDDIEAVGKHVEALAQRFGASVRDFGSASAKLVSNVGRMVATVGKYAAAAGLASAALKKFSQANQDSAEDTKQAIAQSRLQVHSLAEQQQRALQNEQAIRDLNASFAAGKMDIEAYSAALADLKRKQDDEEAASRQRLLIQSAEAEERIRQEAAIKRQAAAEKAFAETTQQFGSDTASALQGLAPAWQSFLTQFNAGPSLIADIMRGITQLLTQNGTEIIATFTRIGGAIRDIFTGGGGGDFATTFANTVMGAFRAIAGVIENVLIPAFKVISTVLQPVANAINAIFGTEITGGIVAATVAVLAWSGAFTVAFEGIMLLINGFKMMRIAMLALSAAGWANPIVLVLAAIAAAVLLIIIYWDDVKAGGIAAAEMIAAAWGALKQTFTDTVKWIQDAWNGTIQFFKDAWNGAVEATAAAMEAIKNAVIKAVPGLEQLIWLIKAAIAAWNQFMGAKSGDSGSPEGKKRGGPIFGRGTGTSDSVPIWASTGEWVIKAKAVEHYGRSFMSAVNSMRLPKDFDIGGGLVVPVPRAAFATGGEVGRSDGGRPVLLQFPDGQNFSLTAASETADRLGRYATSRRLSSAGRKPSYYGSA